MTHGAVKTQPAGRELAKSLFDAVQAGDAVSLLALLGDGNVPLIGDAYNNSLLHIAVSEHHCELADLLVRRGHPVDVVGRQNATPLHVAAIMHSEALCKLLLDSGAPVDREAHGQQRPLHYAGSIGSARICELLVARGANPNAFDERGHTALTNAVRNRHVDAARVLLEHGAYPDIEGYDGVTPLMLAIEARDLSMCALLLKHGADARWKILSMGVRADLDTALHLACLKSSVPIAGLIVEAGLTPSYVPDPCPKGYLTPFQFAVSEAALPFISYFADECMEPVDQLTRDGRSMVDLAKGNQQVIGLLNSLRTNEALRDEISAANSAVARKSRSGMSPL
jgi:ankyrin repeat protein